MQFRACTRMLLLLIFLASTVAGAWADDTLSLKRHVGTQVVEMPLSGLAFITNVALPTENKGWLMFSKDFVSNPTTNVLYMTMNPNDLPSGPWNAYTSGSLLLALQFPELRDGGIYSFDNTASQNVYLIDHYGGYGRPTQLSGRITVEKLNDENVVLSGSISIRPEDTKRSQEIVFANQPVQKVTLAQFGDHQKIRQKKSWEKLEAEANAILNAIFEFPGHARG